MLEIDNFREKNNKIGNINNRKYETNNNILIIKEENKNNFTDNKGNSHKIVEEEININESIKVDGINNRTNRSITSGLVKEINIIDYNNSKVDNIQITSNDNKNKRFTNNVYSANNNINIKERKIINKNSPIDESNNVVNVGSDKKIKINKIEKKIKIPYIYIQNNNKYKTNINKIMMPKPEIALKETINYSNNRVDTKRTIRNYRYKRK
ncbi:hypothetical protein U3516DRAFT_869381 [Neocallimastix sp. 'constans']